MSEDISSILKEHREALETVRRSPLAPVTEYMDENPTNYNITSSPKTKPIHKKRTKRCHLIPEQKIAIHNSVKLGIPYRKIAKINSVSTATVSRLARMSVKQLRAETKAGGHRDSRTKSTVELIKALDTIVAENPSGTLTEYRDKLVENKYPKLSIATISRLTKNMNYSHKIMGFSPPNRNTDLAVNLRCEWSITFQKLKRNHYDFIFIDETSVNVNICRNHGYAKVGETPEIRKELKGKNISCIAAMGEQLGMYQETYSGGVTATIFNSFLINLSGKIKEKYNHKNIIFIMDNATIHKSSQKLNINIPKTIRELGYHYMYTIPYSPMLNAIEYVFNQVKQHIKKEISTNPAKKNNITELIDSGFRSVSKENILNYYRHQYRNVVLSMMRIPLRGDNVKFNLKDIEKEIEVRYGSESLLLEALRFYNKNY